MKRPTIVKIHATFSTLALLLITSFFISSAVVEIKGNASSIQTIKQLILYGVGLLVPSMAITGITGNKLAAKSEAHLIQSKKGRMKWIMILGLTLLTPLAVALNYMAQAHSFGILFYCLQGIEFIAGGTNIFLMGRNVKAGFILSGRMQKSVRD